MNTERNEIRSQCRRTGSGAVALVALVLFAGCNADDSLIVPPPPPPPPPPPLVAAPFVVSDTLLGRARPTAGFSLESLADVAVTYVSLAEGEIPGGSSVRIRNTWTGALVTTPMVAGGFDPVAVEATPGDTLAVSVEVGSASSPMQYLLLVPMAAPPIVVRTEPAQGKRDVPLNARIIIVFSEPIYPAALTGGSIRLKRGQVEVSGALQFEDAERLLVSFVPDEPLTPETNYELSITPGVADMDGEALAVPVAVSFTTAAVAPPSGPASQIAFSALGSDGVQHIFLLDLDRSTLTQLTSDSAPDFTPTWSPDRASIAFVRAGGDSGGIWIMNADGSGAAPRSGLSGAPSWSPDGAWLAVMTGNAMWLVSATAAAEDFKVLDSIPSLVDYRSAAWSPDGSTIAFEGTIDWGGGDWFTQVYLMNADGSNVRRLTSECSYGECGFQSAEGRPAWSPDGNRVAFWSYGFGITWTTRNGSNTGSITQDGLMIDHTGPATGFNAHPSWSPDGQWVVFQSPWPDGQLMVQRADGTGQPIVVTNMAGGASSPAWRP